MRVLLVGDPHVTPSELPDCENLLNLVWEAEAKYGVEADGQPIETWFLGDQHHTHDALSVRVVDFWRGWFDRLHLKKAWRGNHDQSYPDRPHPNAMASYPGVGVVDHPQTVAEGVCGMPYYADPEEFVRDAVALHAMYPGARTLVCHQSFDGAVYDNGSPIKDAVRLDLVPFEFIISGHVHRPQWVGKVWYPGAPRWRAIDDAPHNRYLHVVEFAKDGSYELITKVPTDTSCKRIHHLLDTPDVPVDFAGCDLKRHDVRVDVYGSIAHVRAREAALRALGAKCRPFPTRPRAAKVSEAEGVDKAFARFADGWTAPHGSNVTAVRAALEGRLGS